MLCECIPIGTDVGGIVDIIGDDGFILEPRDVTLAQDQIKNAMNDQGTGKAARLRALKEYPIDKRERLLVELF
jgi:glycosyltransferase involved in cell wall biosynthesis